MAYEVRIETVLPRHLAVLRFQCPVSQIAEHMDSAYPTVAACLVGAGLGPSGPAVAYYRVRGDLLDAAVGFEVGEPFSAREAVVGFELPGGDVAVTWHVGPYSDLPFAYAAMHDYAAAQGRPLDDDAGMWEQYFSPPDTPPQQVRTEIFWPLVTA